MFIDAHGSPSKSEEIFIGVTVSFILATLCVAARLISRFAIVKYWSWDDLLIIVAWVC